jgi:hypothetical protein
MKQQESETVKYLKTNAESHTLATKASDSNFNNYIYFRWKLYLSKISKPIPQKIVGKMEQL